MRKLCFERVILIGVWKMEIETIAKNLG